MSALEIFKAEIRKNLNKHGFPEKKVSFGLDTMYELADKKGLSFTKVRDSLAEESIVTEIVGDKIIFSLVMPDFTPKTADCASDDELASYAQELLGKMSSEQMSKLQDMIAGMDPETIEKMRKEFEKMSPKDRKKMMEQVKNNPF